MDDEDDSKLFSEVNFISHVEVKEEAIILENTSDSESTLSDNEKNSDVKLEECSVCCKYHSMFIILKNHECHVLESDGKCIFCEEISHWLNCFNSHKESHEQEIDHSSDSTTSDREEVEGKCKICLKYEFMVPLLSSHICKINDCIDQKCRECNEVIHWTDCYKKHVESHELKINDESISEIKVEKDDMSEFKNKKKSTSDDEVKKESSSDSTTSDNEEIQKRLCNTEAEGCDQCTICLKYEVMLVILEESHTCEEGESDKECDKCEEIVQWYCCFENHKKSHLNQKNVTNSQHVNNVIRCVSEKFDCSICLKLNSVVTNLVKNHSCVDNKTCTVCQEASYWLSCLKNHKLSETKSDLSDGSDGEELETVKASCLQTNCTVCSKFHSAIINLNGHDCSRKKGKKKCETCHEVSFWFKNFKRHENHHSKQHLPLKNFLSCSNCGKRFSGEKMLNVHKSYCKNSYFTCEVCDKQFLNIFSLKKHKIFQCCRSQGISLQYNCKMCNKIFSNSSDLKKHENFHKDLKSFKCTECFTEFKSEYFLKKHKRIHR